MYRTYKISQQISKNQRTQILDMVIQDAYSISAYVFNPATAIGGYLSAREIVRTKRYLDRIGEIGADGAHLVVSEDNGVVIGFILYHTAIGNDKDIAIASTIVDANYRRKGILKSMMQMLKDDNESISLTCFVEKVPVYENLGFKVLMQQSTQICMYYGSRSDGAIYAVDDEYVDKNIEVRQALAKFRSENADNWKTIWNQIVIDNDAEIRNAETFVESIS